MANKIRHCSRQNIKLPKNKLKEAAKNGMRISVALFAARELYLRSADSSYLQKNYYGMTDTLCLFPIANLIFCYFVYRIT